MKKSFFALSLLIIAGIGALWYFSERHAAKAWAEPAPKAWAGLQCRDCNLIMISLSNVSAERMSLYGYTRPTTPKLGDWAKDAVVFENAFTQSSWTLPVGTTLFTSLYPYAHKIMNRFSGNLLDTALRTLPEILRAQGYRTAAFTGGLDYGKGFGHMRGFETVDEAADMAHAISFAGFNGSLQKASGWLRGNSGKKFFLFIHGYDAHCPFVPPDKFKGKFSTRGKGVTVDNTECLRGYEDPKNGRYEAYYYRDSKPVKVVLKKDDINYLSDLYDEEILSVDELVSDFLSGLDKKVRDKTIIVIFSDHGEMFAKHGRFGRAGTLRGTMYDDVLHVPLIIKLPGQKGKRIKGLVQLIDVMPAVLKNLGIPVPPDAQGKDLAGLITGDSPVNSHVFAGSRFGWVQASPVHELYNLKSVSEAVRTDDWKLIHEKSFTKEGKFLGDAYELYNLKDDPDEMKNIFDKDAPKAEELKAVLDKWSAMCYDFKVKQSSRALPPEVAEEAKKRGYW